MGYDVVNIVDINRDGRYVMKVFGLNLKDQYAELLISAVSVNSPERFSAALSECSPAEITVAERMLNEYFYSTEVLRSSGTRNQRKESVSSFFSVASAPVVAAFIPGLIMKPIDAPRSILLAQMSYGDKFGMDIDLARGYMIERLVTQGNTWEKPKDEYLWLGKNYRSISSISCELEARGSVDAGLIVEMLESVPSMAPGSL
jgi:hypothetical protein